MINFKIALSLKNKQQQLINRPRRGELISHASCVNTAIHQVQEENNNKAEAARARAREREREGEKPMSTCHTENL